MNFESVLTGPGGIMLLLVIVCLALNAYSYWLYTQVANLVRQALEAKESLAGDHTVVTYTKLLYGEVMRGKFYTPTTAVSGNRANDRICREVERSVDFARLKELASWVRDMPPPFNCIPYCV